ncbi:MAG: hypothetical protein OHM77_08730 [Candidatus Nitricoxidivorans perseverans]|uniref:Uncharacterized protein n=1 Tax=Candidatus Nitricoxidivorans perseverans TaxID=2975601 RepID=A0AA49IXL9_9PROT|nr:MAG: hypothetical protein OHM77_08730 [Candidatus Nitricoxidivorans perseverans]
MDLKTMEQALKLQSDLAARLAQNLAPGNAGKMPSIELLLKQKEQAVVRAQAEVEAAIKERDLAVGRWDERVALRKANAAKLQQELGDLNKQLAKRQDVTKDKKPPMRKRTVVTPGKSKK